ncbi:hypothetical protein NQ318_006234, partial [Aromia moschata]
TKRYIFSNGIVWTCSIRSLIFVETHLEYHKKRYFRYAQVCVLLNELYPNRTPINQSTRGKLRPYKIKHVHELNEDDFDRRDLIAVTGQDVVIKQELRSRCAKYSILSTLTAAFPSLRKRILDDEQKLDILLYIQDNPHKPTRQVAADNDVSKTSILRLLKKRKIPPI